MKRFVLLLSVAVAVGLASSAALAAVQSFDGAVTLGTGGWYVDRYAPAGFVGGQTAPDGRTGTLKESISQNDSLSSRPSPYQYTFYNTQGRKYDVGTSSSLFVQLYVPSDWDALDQTAADLSSTGRLASLWGTGFDASNNVTAYPIIEFNTNVDGSSGNAFRVWNDVTGTWSVVSGFSGFNKWYDLGFVQEPLGVQKFYVNGTLVSSVASDPTTSNLGNVMLQGYNAGNSYDIYWDDLRTAGEGAIPEPMSLVIWSLLGGLGLVFIKWQHGRKNA